ncbi:MAG: hypothetical protein WAV86_07975 [Lutibacter sp.]
MKKIITLTILLIFISCQEREKPSEISIDFSNNNFSVDGESIYYGASDFKLENTSELNITALELAKQKNFKKARKILLKALSIEPENPILLNNLGNIEKLSPNGSNAKKYYEKSFKASDSTYLISALNLGIMHFYSGNFDQSEKLFKYVISKTNDNLLIALSNLELTKIYIDSGKCSDAKKSFRTAEKILNELNILENILNNLKINHLNYCQN